MSAYNPKRGHVPKGKTRIERTVLVEEGAGAKMPSAVGPSESEPTHTSWSRLDHLYRITKLLLKFENMNKTLNEILAIVSNTLPLRSAILIDETKGRAQVSVWADEGVNDEQLKAARTHATNAYAYLTGSDSTLETNANVTRERPLNLSFVEESKTDQNCVVLPMVVGRQPIFGAIQFEGTARFNEHDLTFINAIANQLAVALDQHKAWRQELAARAEAEAAARRMRFLADASRLLAASLDYLHTWETMAQLAVRHIADICILDILEEDQSTRRIPVRSPNLPKDVTEKEIEGVVRNVVSEVMRTNRPRLYNPDLEPSKKSESAEGIERSIVNESSDFCKSCMCVPLRVSQRTLGTMTMISMRPDRLYSRADLAILQDLASRAVTAFKNAQLYQTALQAIRSRDDLLSVVSHDLRTPLAVIIGWVDMFLAGAQPGELVSADTRHFEAIRRSTSQMRRLIDDLLTTASIEARHVPADRDTYPVIPLVHEAMELMQPLTIRKDVQLKSELPPQIAPVFVDRDRIMQVFINLIDNAIKFSWPGGSIAVRAEESENDVRFSIEDTGPGIPEDYLANIFDRFWPTLGARKGAGLGLFIVKGIVEAHGGKAWVQSKVGVGSTFFFTLPVNPPDERAERL